MLHGLIDNVAVKVSWMVTKVVPQSKQYTIERPNKENNKSQML